MKLTSFGPFAAALALSGTAGAQTLPPNPVLYLMGLEEYTTASGAFTRYRYDVHNKTSYPAAMFAPAPQLPPCGNNANSARSWVDFFDKDGRRLYGFCALGSPNDLGSIWFALPSGTVPPSYVYIEIHDRQTNTRLRSNLADTTP
ncbi:MAG TPA: hypothetical protein VMG08_18105 [Allosphingosinicella sp.]|nr:hypothetical protein [Allosphingosinicella sp.]